MNLTNLRTWLGEQTTIQGLMCIVGGALWGWLHGDWATGATLGGVGIVAIVLRETPQQVVAQVREMITQAQSVKVEADTIKAEAGAIVTGPPKAPTALSLAAAAVLCGSLVACQLPAPAAARADPAVIAKINYVCAYSGLFKFADTAAASVVPVPGAAMAASLINSGVDQTCLHPEAVATDIAVVENLIDQFRAAGKM